MPGLSRGRPRPAGPGGPGLAVAGANMPAPVGFRPLLLLVPSQAAATELPRRLASTGRAVAGLYAWKPLDLARVLAEPVLLGRGLRAWDPGHDALLAARLLAQAGGAGLKLADGAPLAPVA